MKTRNAILSIAILVSSLGLAACGNSSGEPIGAGNSQGPTPEPSKTFLQVLAVATPMVDTKCVTVRFNEPISKGSLENGIVFTDSVTHQVIPFAVEMEPAETNVWNLSPNNPEQAWPLGHTVSAVMAGGKEGPQGVKGDLALETPYPFSFTVKVGSLVEDVPGPAQDLQEF
ncbi:MAG: hypothetical protein U1F66_00835 [bacterium]